MEYVKGNVTVEPVVEAEHHTLFAAYGDRLQKSAADAKKHKDKEGRGNDGV